MNTKKRAIALAIFFTLLTTLSSVVFAQETLDLTVSGGEDDFKVTRFDLAALDALPQIEFTTLTIWTDGPQVFSGVPLKTLLTSLDLEGETLRMTALNDYSVTMSISNLSEAAPIIATRVNGELMSVRDKGPFWVVFPYDADPMFQTERVFSQSIWQLNRLHVSD